MQTGQLNRREFITLLGGVAAWPLAARAQQMRSPYRLGFLGLLPGENTTTFMKSLLERLNELGYHEGHNMIFDYRQRAGNWFCLDRRRHAGAERGVRI
jgi:hypothetical protein